MTSNYNGETVLWIWEEDLEKPLKARKSKIYTVSDLFHESVTDEQRDRILAVMVLTPQHTYQVLTNQPDRMMEYFSNLNDRTIKIIDSMPEWIGMGAKYVGKGLTSHLKEMQDFLPLPNLWLGVTVENQKAADDRVPLLLKTPAAIRFLSCEPLLEEIDLEGWLDHWQIWQVGITESPKQKINWVVVGGESGHDARSCDIKWIRAIAAQCKSANVPVFVKQLGSKPYISVPNDFSDSTKSYHDLNPLPRRVLWTGEVYTWQVSDRKGGKIDEFPEDLQIREMPVRGGVK